MVESVDQEKGNPVSTIENFTLLKILGIGQFGTGYLTKQDEKYVCVKVFHDESESEIITYSFKVELG